MSSPLSQDYFQLFGFPRTYQIDSDTLMQRYRELQHSAHPDRFASASGQERRLSVQTAAHINEAYQTLKSPLLRARYLLELAGIDAVQQAQALGNEFLLEQMELREQLADLPEQPDALLALIDAREDLVRRQRDLQEEFAALAEDMENGDSAPVAHAVFNKMQFFHRLLEEVDMLEERLQES